MRGRRRGIPSCCSSRLENMPASTQRNMLPSLQTKSAPLPPPESSVGTWYRRSSTNSSYLQYAERPRGVAPVAAIVEIRDDRFWYLVQFMCAGSKKCWVMLHSSHCAPGHCPKTASRPHTLPPQHRPRAHPRPRLGKPVTSSFHPYGMAIGCIAIERRQVTSHGSTVGFLLETPSREIDARSHSLRRSQPGPSCVGWRSSGNADARDRRTGW